MNIFNFIISIAGMMLCGHAMAAEWVPIKQNEKTVREIDMSSMLKKGSVATFVARHTFADKNEYKVGRRDVKYLLMTSRVNCDSRTLAQLATEAFDENMGLISKQKIQLPQEDPVTQGSIDESALDLACATGSHSQK